MNGDLERADAFNSKAIEIARRLDDDRTLCEALFNPLLVPAALSGTQSQDLLKRLGELLAIAERLNDFSLAYLHVIEPRIKGGELIIEGQGSVAAQELSKIFHGPVIAAGGFERDTAEATVANGDASLIAFGRHFIANPDLSKRIELGLPLNPYDRSTFYGFEARGYTDYPTYEARESNQAISA